MSLTQNEAWRFVSIIDERIRKALGRGTVLEITYGDVDAVDTAAHTCSVLIGGDTNPSEGFRVPTGMRLVSGDRVRVAIDPRGDRYVQEAIGQTTYPTLLVDPIRGFVYMGDGTGDPTLTIYSDGPALGGINTDKPSYFADSMQVDADLEAYSLTVDNEFTLSEYPGCYFPVAQSTGSLTNGSIYTLSFTTEPAGSRDPLGMHFSFDPTHFAINRNGLYEVDVDVDWGFVSSTAGRGTVLIYKNGSLLAAKDFRGAADVWRTNAHFVLDLVVTDYLEVKVENQTGVTRTAVINSVSIKKVSV